MSITNTQMILVAYLNVSKTSGLFQMLKSIYPNSLCICECYDVWMRSREDRENGRNSREIESREREREKSEKKMIK